MLAACAKLYLARHAVDLLTHFIEGGVDTLAFGFDILSNGVLNADIWLMENSNASRCALNKRQSCEANRARVIAAPGAWFVN